jgi:HK97 family phage prohead protease
MRTDRFGVPFECKFLGDGSAGEFEGYGAVFSNVDGHGDMIAPGAFTASLATHRAKGTMPGMYAEHGFFAGTDVLPIGVWKSIEEDDRGLRVKGKLSALDTDHGRRMRSLMQDGALKGLSIAYKVAKNGAIYGKDAGEPRRTLKQLHLHEISVVQGPSNHLARIDQVKSALATGELPTLREFEEYLREKGFSWTQATHIAERGFKSLLSRERPAEEAIPPEARNALSHLGSVLKDFALPR